ncbi:MAG: hypothetical protein HQK83_15005 [Fibrobacteria bacterium]|nr:hypothetical protein [Fibrobacteria bacterium]
MNHIDAKQLINEEAPSAGLSKQGTAKEDSTVLGDTRVSRLFTVTDDNNSYEEVTNFRVDNVMTRKYQF